MRLYKRGAFWWCSFPWRGETVRRSTRCTTRTAALLTAQRWERERADPDHAAAAAATFGGAVTAFLADLERTAKPVATKRFYRARCGTLLRLLGPERPLSEVTAALVDKYIAARELEPVAFDDKGAPTRFVSANTIHKELVALRQTLKRAKRRGEFRRDVSEVLPVGFSPRYVPRKVALTLEQAGTLCRALPAHRAAPVAFALATTARYAEVFRAMPFDCWVATSLVQLRGTKTQAAARAVKVPPFAVPLLAFALEHGTGSGGLLFAPWPNSHRDIAAACRRIGAPEVTWNDLRRTMATWLLEGGVSTYLVSKMLGHTTTKMVETVYGKPRDEALGTLMTKQAGAIPAITMDGGRDEHRSVELTTGAPECPPPKDGAVRRLRRARGGGGVGSLLELHEAAPRIDVASSPALASEIGVRPPYVSAAEQAPPQPTAAAEIAGNTEESGGPPGNRTLDQVIKSPVAGAFDVRFEGVATAFDWLGRVPLVREVNASDSSATRASTLKSVYTPDALRWALEEHRGMVRS